MWKPSPKCKICALIMGGDTDLQRRIYASSYFGNADGESLAAIRTDYPNLNGTNFTGHVNKHQVLDNASKVRRSVQAIASIEERKLEVIAKTKPAEIWETVLEQGLEDIREGKIRLSANNVLKAAADKSNADFKQKDQELKLAEMVFHFASGENNAATAYEQRIIEGQAPTSFDPSALTARSVEQVSD